MTQCHFLKCSQERFGTCSCINGKLFAQDYLQIWLTNFSETQGNSHTNNVSCI